MENNQVEITELHTPTEHKVGFIFDVFGFTPRLILWTTVSTAKALASWLERWLEVAQAQMSVRFDGDGSAFMIARPGCTNPGNDLVVEVFDGLDKMWTTITAEQAKYMIEEIGKVQE